MYTQCPECLTIFAIDEDALQASLGIVRCGHCSQRFDALRSLSNSLPTDVDAALPAQDAEALTPTLTQAISADAIKAASSRRRERKAAAEPPSLPPTAAAADADTDSDTDWLTPAAARTRDLLAEAAGIPHDVMAADADWQATDLPIQTELDIIPMATDATLGEPDATTAAEPAAADVEATATAAIQPTPDASTDAASGNTVDATADATAGEPAADPATDADPLADPGDNDEGFADADAASSASTPAIPLYVPPRQHRSYLRSGLWALGCLLLGAILAAQLAWAQRTNLMLDPATRPWVLRACANFDCQMPPIRDVAKLELLSRDIRPDPKAAGALMITATVRNDAAFTQPWPVVVVKLSDLDNNPVAMRRFRPRDYMPDPARRAAGITAGTTAAVAFEVADPGKRAVAFSFSFE